MNVPDLDKQFSQLQKERACFHWREKFYQQLSKKKLPKSFFITHLSNMVKTEFQDKVKTKFPKTKFQAISRINASANA
jgi:hypothetical protein